MREVRRFELFNEAYFASAHLSFVGIAGDNIRNEADVQGLVSRIRFTGLTPFGSQLNQKVIEPLILGPARQGRLQKPVSIIAITDGCPAGEECAAFPLLPFLASLTDQMVGWQPLHPLQDRHQRQPRAVSHQIRPRCAVAADCPGRQ